MRGKRVGSAQSARRIQPGGHGTAPVASGIPSRDPGRRGGRPRPGAFPPLCSAPRPALGRLGKARREGGSQPRLRSLQRVPPGPRRFPGPWTECSLRLLAPSRGRDGAPLLPARLSTRADCPQCAPTASRRQGGDRPTYNRRQGSAAMSATHPTRLETRTKESNALASQRVPLKPRGAMKVRAGARRLRWDPRPPGRGAPPARLGRTVGEVERERVR